MAIDKYSMIMFIGCNFDISNFTMNCTSQYVTRPAGQKHSQAGEALELFREMEVTAENIDDGLYQYQGVTYSKEDIINWFRYIVRFSV